MPAPGAAVRRARAHRDPARGHGGCDVLAGPIPRPVLQPAAVLDGVDPRSHGRSNRRATMRMRGHAETGRVTQSLCPCCVSGTTESGLVLSVQRPVRFVDWRSATEYDNCMKRITVSLPDELVEKIKHAAGGERQVSSYVATALEAYQERERLDDILAAWRAETPVPDDVRRQVETELDQVGLTSQSTQDNRLAG